MGGLPDCIGSAVVGMATGAGGLTGKRKGIHQRTYDQLREEYCDAQSSKKINLNKALLINKMGK
jgi:hypothetical protein